ncbi:MAG: hypothetical protein ACREFP_12670 [Acetobacteraceae bacterium]
MADRPSGGAMGFLAMAFVIVGLAGVFASYAAPVPLARALRTEAALDQVLATAGKSDQAAELAKLRPALGPHAASVLEGPGTLEARVAAARTRLMAHVTAEQAAVGARLRLLVVVATIAAALFGIAMLGVRRRDP